MAASHRAADVEDEESDPIERALDVYLSVGAQGPGTQMALLSTPLRPPWRPYEYSRVKEVRMKPTAQRLELDVPLDTQSVNYRDVDEEGSSQKMEKVTLRSSVVESRVSTALASLHQGKLLLAPLGLGLQLRPHLSHLNLVRKGGKDGEDGDEHAAEQQEEEKEEQPALRAVEVQVQKRETERQLQQRINSYAYISQKEEEEAWKELRVHTDKSPLAHRMWERVMEPLTSEADGGKKRSYLSRQDYLMDFAPAMNGAAVGSEAGGEHRRKSTKPELATTKEELSEAALRELPKALQRLFAQHSVCSMANVRQWLRDPRGGGGGAAREGAQLTDQALKRAVLDHSRLPLVCIRRMYVLKAQGKPDQDPIRKLVVELLQDKDHLKRNDVVEAGKMQGVEVPDSLYGKVLKDLCVSKGQTWTLRQGADMAP